MSSSAGFDPTGKIVRKPARGKRLGCGPRSPGMDVTLLGTGSPVPTLEHAGTSLAVEVGDETHLVDCGPGATHRMIEHEVHPGDVVRLFLTHNHIDHTADFFHFVVASWSLGRDALAIYGPPGTDRLLPALREVYAEDIAYRTRFYDEAGIEDVDWTETAEGEVETGDGWRVAALPVDHSIETHAYRFESADATFVFTADTTPMDGLAEFAAGADLLLADACVARETATPPERGLVWDRLTDRMGDEQAAGLRRTHCTPAEAGALAAAADVETLALTHHLPYRDMDAMVEEARSEFDGRVVAAADGMRFRL